MHCMVQCHPSSSEQLSDLLLQGSGMDSDSDLAQLCATFSASPFIMAFAQVRAVPTGRMCITMHQEVVTQHRELP